MCGSWCAVMTIIIVAVRLISDFMCPLLPENHFILLRGDTQTDRQAGSLPASSSLNSFSCSSFHFPPHKMTPLKLTCASKMLIKQTHFSSRARPNKRASTFPFKSEWQRNTTAANAPSLYSGNISRRYSVENINFRCWGEEKRRAFCLLLLVWAWYAAWAFQAIC